MEESENDVGSLEQLLLYAGEHYLAGKVPLGDHLGKVLHGVEEYHQRCLHTRTRLSSVPKTNRDSSLNTTFCQSVTFYIDLDWHHCRCSCRCSGVKASAGKGRLDLRFTSARCLEIVCGTIATPASAHIVERVTVERVTVYHDPSILSPRGLPRRSRPGFPRVGTFSCPLLPSISNGTLRTIPLASNTTRRPTCSFHPDDQASLKLAYNSICLEVMIRINIVAMRLKVNTIDIKYFFLLFLVRPVSIETESLKYNGMGLIRGPVNG
ncbi:uncharacterized protein TNCV_4795851 [Trichonephila clavipes]|nr:uncharacterized protein TNCV_4795851 [Trichonephila clavipes]